MKIAVLDDYQGVALALADWDSLGAEITVFGEPIPVDRQAETLAPFDVVCLMRERTPFPAELIDNLVNLKLLVTTGARNLSLDVAAAQRRGIVVSGTQNRPQSTPQHILTLILAATRGLVGEALSVRDGGWQRGLGRDLDGMVLGIVGLGRIGAQVAGLAKHFGVEIVAWSENLTDERCAEVGVRKAASCDALLGEADIVSIHLLLSERSRGFVDAARIARMKPDAVLVNTSRGPILDWLAALDAVRQDRLGVLAMDVFDEEPLPADHPLRDRELIDRGRLLLTPHIAYVTRQNYEIFYRQTVEAIAAWKQGQAIRPVAG